MDLQIEPAAGGGRTLTLRHPSLVVAGYTGRHRAGVLAHIEELARHGIPAPDHVPAYYPLPGQLLTLSDDPVEVAGDHTSGEVEPVLIVTDHGRFIAVGSDHTDRDAERQSIPLSKRLAAKVISRVAWPLQEVAGHWDQLLLRSWVGDDTPYQDTPVGSVMPLEAFPVSRLRRPGRDLVLFLGTVPLIGGAFVMAKHFRAELADPVLRRRLSLAYTVQTLALEGEPHAQR